MRRSRRGFLKLLAAGSAATIVPEPVARVEAATGAAPAGAKPKSGGAPTHGAIPRELEAEIERQQRDLEKTLKTIRDYPLEPGSNPAFRFAPIRAGRAAGTGGGESAR